MKKLMILAIVVLFGCKATKDIPKGYPLPTGVDMNEVHQWINVTSLKIASPWDCTEGMHSNKPTVEDTFFGSTFYVTTNRIKSGPDKGQWHSPKNEWCRVFYDLSDVPFLWFSYEVQVFQDAVFKVRGKEVRFPAKVHLYSSVDYPNGVLEYTHAVNSWEHSTDPSTGAWGKVAIDAAILDTLWIQDWDCDIPSPKVYY